jgi:acetyl-CoA carboxylase carboxyl transferase subunit beta
VILHGNTEFAEQMAHRQRISAADLLADGTVHAVVAEQTPAHADPASFARRIAAEVLRQIDIQRGFPAAAAENG